MRLSSSVQTKVPPGTELHPQEVGRVWHHSEPYKDGPSAAAAAAALTLCSLPAGDTLTGSCCTASASVQEAVRLQVSRPEFRGIRELELKLELGLELEPETEPENQK